MTVGVADIVVEFADGTGLGSTPTWTNVSSKVKRVSTSRGRAHVEDTFDTGKLTIVLDDRDGDFDPANTSSPYYGKLGVNHAWRVSFPGTYIGYGYTDAISRVWPGGFNYSETTISCSDRFKVLNKTTFGPITRSATAPGEGTDVRVDAILDALGVGATSSSRLVNAGGWVARNVEATTYPAKTNGLSSLQDIVKAEGGVFYVNGAGVIVYDVTDARTSETRSNTSQATYQFGLANVGGAFDVVEDLNLVYDDELFANYVRVTDSAGVEHAWPAIYPPSDPVEFDLGDTLLNGVDAGFRARDLYASRFTVVSRVDSATLDCGNDTAYRAEALAREISDRITAVIEPRNGGATFTQDYFIESVHHDIDVEAGLWRASFGVNPVPADLSSFYDVVSGLSPTAYWRLGSDTTWAASGIIDATGHGHHGTGAGTTYTLGQTGLTTDGDQAVVVPSATPSGSVRLTQASWMEGTSVSWAFAVKIAAPPGSGLSAPVSRRSFGVNGVPYAFYIESGANASATPAGVAGALDMLVVNNGTGVFTWQAGTGVNICDGVAHLIVCTISYNGSVTTSKCYLDGLLKGTSSFTGRMPNSTGDATSVTGSDITLGSEWTGAAYTRGLNGTLDEVAFWAGVALSATQVANIYNAWV